MPKLGVNIDHVATLRQARRGREPDPVWAAAAAELGGADQITVHLREDRRHIQERDLELLLGVVQTRVNLEMAVAPAIIRLACRLRPACACLVPERREELTTEGGLDAAGRFQRVREAAGRLGAAGIIVSLFIEAAPEQIRAAGRSGAPFIELHTGRYANARGETGQAKELARLADGVALARSLGLRVNAGHGLNYQNVVPVARLPGVEELNIGHAIIARALFVGLTEAVREMKRLAAAGS